MDYIMLIILCVLYYVIYIMLNVLLINLKKTINASFIKQQDCKNWA